MTEQRKVRMSGMRTHGVLLTALLLAISVCEANYLATSEK